MQHTICYRTTGIGSAVLHLVIECNNRLELILLFDYKNLKTFQHHRACEGMQSYDLFFFAKLIFAINDVGLFETI